MARIDIVLLAAGVLLIAGCASPDKVTFHQADAYPERLSAWGLITPTTDGFELAGDSRVYSLNTALFTDYAQKLRTVHLPAGTSAAYEPYEAFSMPVGSVISKTFFYLTDQAGNLLLDGVWDENPASLGGAAKRVVETRLLVRQPQGWDALPYVWRGDDAYLSITGDLLSLTTSNGERLHYVVPSRNQCAGCHASNHTTGDILPIGIKARHLNRPDPVQPGNQLDHWQAAGLLNAAPVAMPRNARWLDPTESLAHRARSYLDINCGHCHNPAGAADTSGLLLDYQDHDAGALGRCKPPIAAGRGSGGLLYSIVPGRADQSIITYRMNTTDPATMMPELGRSLVHVEGVELIAAWINSMDGLCR